MLWKDHVGVVAASVGLTPGLEPGSGKLSLLFVVRSLQEREFSPVDEVIVSIRVVPEIRQRRCTRDTVGVKNVVSVFQEHGMFVFAGNAFQVGLAIILVVAQIWIVAKILALDVVVQKKAVLVCDFEFCLCIAKAFLDVLEVTGSWKACRNG